MGLRTSEREFHRVVAIDGPAASGKSSVARELAGRLGFIYVNSGAVYRAITWYLLEKGIYAEDSNRIAEALESAAITGCRRGESARDDQVLGGWRRSGCPPLPGGCAGCAFRAWPALILIARSIDQSQLNKGSRGFSRDPLQILC